MKNERYTLLHDSEKKIRLLERINMYVCIYILGKLSY